MQNTDILPLDTKLLDQIVKTTIEAVEKGKSQIFDIYEAARSELEHIKRDVERVKEETADIIYKVDELEKKERRARLRLMEVSRSFRVYTEEDIKSAYDEARNLQIELAVAREQEQSLRRQRDDLELRFKSIKTTVNKAESLVSQVGAVLGYLGTQMGGVMTKLESLQQSQVFGAKIIQAQEEERRRVAREIHDGPAQAMANVVFRAEVCERLVDMDIERAKNELQDLREQVRTCLKETRKIIFDLRPMTLDDLGLVPTVKRFVDTVRERTAITADLRMLGEEKRLENYLEIGLFRIIQEALNNVEKHAQADNVSIVLEFGQNFVAAVIEDDGQGFEVDEEASEESFGLMGMKERINLLNGALNIKSALGQGTKVSIKIPIK